MDDMKFACGLCFVLAHSSSRRSADANATPVRTLFIFHVYGLLFVENPFPSCEPSIIFAYIIIMAIGAFPLIKLGALALRQISKPLANHLKNKAKTSDFVRTHICMPPAQFYHYLEVNVKARLLNLGKPKEVVKLNEQAAVELGSDIIGEMVMFGIAATTVVIEFTRQSRKSAEEKAAMEARLQRIESANNESLERYDALQLRLAKIEENLATLKKK